MTDPMVGEDWAPVVDDDKPRQCASCHRNMEMFNRPLQLEWVERTYAHDICPVCITKFVGSPKTTERPRCAGCGARKAASALSNNVCKTCKDKGVSAPTLF